MESGALQPWTQSAPTPDALQKKRDRCPDPHTKRATAIEICDAGLNMATPPKMRDLALSLMACEANASKTSEPAELTILRVYEKLRRSLGEFAGTAAFRSLASRALAMARSEVPSLRAVQVAEDGALQGLGHGPEHRLGEFGPQIDFEEDRPGGQRTGDDGIAVIARLLGLLLIFLGEPITLRLLRNAWPGAAFDDHSSEMGRKP